jgi:hypothetical protein
MLTSQQLYLLSKKYVGLAHAFKDVHKELFEYNLLRYSFFVDGSTAGTKCHFAQASEQLIHQDGELVEIRKELEEALKEINEMIKGIDNARASK